MFARDLLNPGLPYLAADQVKQQSARRRAHRRRKHVDPSLSMVSGGQNDYEQVVSDGKKQEGRIHHTHEKWTQVAEVKQHAEKMLEKARQDVIVAGSGRRNSNQIR